MNVGEIVEHLGLQVLTGTDHLDGEVSGGYVADLLSCVAGAEARDSGSRCRLNQYRGVASLLT